MHSSTPDLRTVPETPSVGCLSIVGGLLVFTGAVGALGLLGDDTAPKTLFVPMIVVGVALIAFERFSVAIHEWLAARRRRRGQG